MTEKTLQTTDNREAATAVQEKTRSEEKYVAPFVDIYEDPDKLTVVADLPGAEKESVGVNVKDGILTISAKRQSLVPGEPVYREFGNVNYYRQFELSEAVDIEKISAELTNGVLNLHLPKAEKMKPRQIEVKLS